MLFHVSWVIDLKYNLKCTKHIIRKLTSTLNFDAPITYCNLGNILTEIYQLHALRLGENVSQHSPHPPNTNLDQQDVELLNLYNYIRDERFHVDSSTMSLSYALKKYIYIYLDPWGRARG